MANRKPKRPRDANQLAKSIVDIAVADAPAESVKAAPSKQTIGGRQRAINLSAEKRREIAKKAAETRWAKKKQNLS